MDETIEKNLRDQPSFTHDCDKCEFLTGFALGNEFLTGFALGKKWYDLYRCQSLSGPSYIARYSDEPSEYWSMPWDVLKDVDPGKSDTTRLLRIVQRFGLAHEKNLEVAELKRIALDSGTVVVHPVRGPTVAMEPLSRARVIELLVNVYIAQVEGKTDQQVLDELHTISGVKVRSQVGGLTIEVPFPLTRLSIDLLEETEPEHLSLPDTIQGLKNLEDVVPIGNEGVLDQAIRFLEELKKERGA